MGRLKIFLVILLTTTLTQNSFPALKKNIVWDFNLPEEEPIEGTQIGVIELRGTITESNDISLQLQAMANDTNIKAVLLLIDSGGGSAGHSYSIFNEIKHCTSKKPVIAFVESVACSGAYLSACAANAIIVSGGGSVGSVGVISGPDYRIIPSHYNDGNVAGEVEYDPITAGKYKDVLNPNRELTSEERDYLQDDADKMYTLFCKTISKQRNIPLEKSETWAEGKVFNVEDAKKLKLIDSIGSLTDALIMIKNALKMKGIKTSNLVLVSVATESDEKEDSEKEK